MLAYEDVPEAKAPVMVLPIDVGHSIGVVQDPGVTQRVTDDGDSNDQGTHQGVDHQGTSVLPQSRGLCDGRCCAVKRTRVCTQCPTCCCVSDPDPSIKCTQYGQYCVLTRVCARMTCLAMFGAFLDAHPT